MALTRLPTRTVAITSRRCAEGDEVQVRESRNQRARDHKGGEGRIARGRRPRDHPELQGEHRVLSARREALGRELSVAAVERHECRIAFVAPRRRESARRPFAPVRESPVSRADRQTRCNRNLSVRWSRAGRFFGFRCRRVNLAWQATPESSVRTDLRLARWPRVLRDCDTQRIHSRRCL